LVAAVSADFPLQFPSLDKVHTAKGCRQLFRVSRENPPGTIEPFDPALGSGTPIPDPNPAAFTMLTLRGTRLGRSSLGGIR
jgi:hypothetical protein